MSVAAPGAPLLARVVGYSVAIANNAGKIIREIMKKGELGIVEKEAGLYSSSNKELFLYLLNCYLPDS